MAIRHPSGRALLTGLGEPTFGIKKNGRLAAAVTVHRGGGGENRTRVRKHSTVGTTCLVSSLCSHPHTADGQAELGQSPCFNASPK